MAAGFTTTEVTGTGSVVAVHGQRTGGGNMVANHTGTTERSCIHINTGAPHTHIGVGQWAVSASTRMAVAANVNADGDCTVEVKMAVALSCDGGPVMTDSRTVSVMAVWVNNANPVTVVGPDGAVLVNQTDPLVGGTTLTNMHVVLIDQGALTCSFVNISPFITSATINVDWSGIGAGALVGQIGELDGDMAVLNLHYCQ